MRAGLASIDACHRAAGSRATPPGDSHIRMSVSPDPFHSPCARRRRSTHLMCLLERMEGAPLSDMLVQRMIAAPRSPVVCIPWSALQSTWTYLPLTEDDPAPDPLHNDCLHSPSRTVSPTSAQVVVWRKGSRNKPTCTSSQYFSTWTTGAENPNHTQDTSSKRDERLFKAQVLQSMLHVSLWSRHQVYYNGMRC